MFVYFMMYFFAAVAAMGHVGKRAKSGAAGWMLVGIGLVIIIGLRHHVGGDWNNYVTHFNELRWLSFDKAMSMSDPGYQLLSYWMNDWGWGIYMVNFISAILFVSGLIALLRRQINPWLGLVVAIPYLVIVVSMGYTRQGVAIGLVMWGIAALDRGKFFRFVFFVLLAVTFHKSAILMMAFGIFQQGRGKIIKLLAIVFVGMGVWSSLVEESSVHLWKNYVEEQMQSQGAMIRVMLNLLPSVLLLLFRKEWKKHFEDYTFWLMIALASIASVGLVSFASTAVDRMALYFIPIQMVVFARLPFLVRHRVSQKTTTFLVLLLYFMVLVVWLFFAANVRYWVPYHNILFWSL